MLLIVDATILHSLHQINSNQWHEFDVKPSHADLNHLDCVPTVLIIVAIQLGYFFALKHRDYWLNQHVHAIDPKLQFSVLWQNAIVSTNC